MQKPANFIAQQTDSRDTEANGPSPYVFYRLRGWLLRNSARVLMRQSIVRILTFAAVSLVVGGFVFGISLEGFHYLRTFRLPAIGSVIGLIFDLLFLTLNVMLLFSTALILYSSLFASAEARFLLHLPAPADRIFAYKFQGALAFSSWAFLLLGAPVLIAYGLIYSAPLPYFALLPLFFLGFVLLPGSLGALIIVLVVNAVPKRRRQVLILLAFVLAVAGGLLMYRAFRQATRPDNMVNRDSLHQLMGWFTFAQGLLMPNHWMTGGLQSAARGYYGKSLYYLGLIWSWGLAFYLLAAWTAKHLYRRGYNRVATGGELKKRYSGRWLDDLLAAALRFLDPRLRLLIVKDFRTFRRDPAQWAQVLIFTGLLTLYFVNIRNLFAADIPTSYQNGVSLLNLMATALLLCTYTGRFIYPMMSLEGRKFWILGLLPLERERLLWGKFAFSSVGGLLIAEFLVVLSNLMLGVWWVVLVLHVITVAMLAIGLSGLSVGLSACIPNFRETDPSKIAVGFGGTLNLVAGLLFLCVVVAVMAAPWHIYLAFGEEEFDPRAWWLLLGIGPGVVIGILAAVLPLRAGARALRRMEF
jgi:ABC-2 type transport system permease protein